MMNFRFFRSGAGIELRLVLAAILFVSFVSASETVLNFATGLMVRKEYDLAIDELKRILEEDPKFVHLDRVVFRLGECHYQTGAPREALRMFERLIEQHPTSPECPQALYRTGQLHAEKSPEKAAQAFAILAERFPEHNLAPTARYWAAEALLRAELYAQAETGFRQAMDAFPDMEAVEQARFGLAMAVFRQPNRFDDALKLFDEFLAKHPKSERRVAAGLKAAECRYRIGRHAEALEAYRAFQKHPGTAGRDAALGMAWALFDLERHAEAIDAFLAAAQRETDPERQALHRFNAANAAVRAESFERAAKLFAEVVERGPETDLGRDARLWQGRCLLRAHKPAEAETLLSEPLGKYEPQDLDAALLYTLGEALSQQGKHDQAADRFSSLAQHHSRDPLAPRALYAAALAWEAAEQPAKAIERAQLLLNRYPQDELVESSRFVLGMNRFRLGQYAEALEAFEAMILVPSEVAIDRDYHMAWSWFHLKRFAKARGAFEKLARTDSGKALAAEALFLAGKSAAEMGDPDLARRHFTAAARAGPPPSPFGARARLSLSLLDLNAAGSDAPANGYEAAVARLTPLLAQGEIPADIRSHVRLTLGQALQSLERHAEALTVLAEDPSGEDPLKEEIAFARAWSQYRIQKIEPALEGFSELARGKGPRAAEAGFWRARILEPRDATEAAAEYGQWLKRFAEHELKPEATYRRALMLAQAGVAPAAAEHFERMAAAAPESPFAPHALYELAWLRWRRGEEGADAAAAAETFARLIESYPDHPMAVDARFRLGEIEQESGRHAAALEHYLQVRQDGRFESGDVLHYRIGWCCLELERFAEAAEAFEALAKGFPDSAMVDEAGYRAGCAHRELENFDAAVAWFDNVESDDLKVSARFSAAECRRAAGNHRDAIERYRALLKASPEETFRLRGTLGLAHALRSAGAHADALETYARLPAMTAGIEAAEACLGSGYCRLALNQPRLAAKEFHKVDIVYGFETLKPKALRMLVECYRRLDDAERVEKYRNELHTRFPDAQQSDAS